MGKEKREFESVDYLYRINEQYDHMTKSQKKIARYLVEHKDDVGSLSITVLAKKLGVTPSAITRFCQSLNYKGFSEMKIYVGKSILGSYSAESDLQKEDSMAVVMQKLMIADQQAIADTMLLLDHKKLKQVAELCVRAPRIHFYGEGATGLSAGMAAAIFMQIGVPCQDFTDSVLMRLGASVLEKGDIAFGITYSGKAYDVIEALKIAKKNGARTVAITSKPGSPIVNVCDYSLLYSNNIQDDLTFLPIARICEIAIMGLLQVAITRSTKQSPQRLQEIRNSIEQIRKSHNRTGE